jgi:hypothetical protein
MAQGPRIGADPRSLGPGVTAAFVEQAWEDLKTRAGKLDAPKEALQPLYSAYANVAVALSSNQALSDIMNKWEWGTYNSQLTALEAQHPQKKNLWPWVAAAAAVGGWWLYRRNRRRMVLL